MMYHLHQLCTLPLHTHYTIFLTRFSDAPGEKPLINTAWHQPSHDLPPKELRYPLLMQNCPATNTTLSTVLASAQSVNQKFRKKSPHGAHSHASWHLMSLENAFGTLWCSSSNTLVILWKPKCANHAALKATSGKKQMSQDS